MSRNRRGWHRVGAAATGALAVSALVGDAPLKVDASHDIQFDHLDAITAAIDDVLARIRPS